MIDIDFAKIPPGDFRLIALATGELLNMNDPTLGHPDGLALWDATRDAGRSRRQEPVARCLFPDCVAAGRSSLYLQRRGELRVACHHEKGGVSHRVAAPTSPEHRALVSLWAGLYGSAGYTATVEPTVRRTRPDVLVEGGAVRVSTEVQLSPEANAVRRYRKAQAAGIAQVWQSGPAVNLRDRVPETRFLSDIPEVLQSRRPQDLTLLGVRDLVMLRCFGNFPACPETGRANCRQFHPKPTPRPVAAGSFAERMPAGDLTTVPYGKQILIVPKADASNHEPAGNVAAPERPARPRGENRRHVELAATRKRTKAGACLAHTRWPYREGGWHCRVPGCPGCQQPLQLALPGMPTPTTPTSGPYGRN